MNSSIIGTVAGAGDCSPNYHTHEVICLPYSQRYGTLPAKKMQVSRLISSLTTIPIMEVNRLLESDKPIVVSKGHKTHNDAWVVGKLLSDVGMMCEIVGKTTQQSREDSLNEILK